jgi:hypothetical protein
VPMHERMPAAIIFGPAFVLAPSVLALAIGLAAIGLRWKRLAAGGRLRSFGLTAQVALGGLALLLSAMLPADPMNLRSGPGGANCADTHSALAGVLTVVALACGAAGGLTVAGASVATTRSGRLGFVVLAVAIPLVAAVIRFMPEVCDYT